MQGWKYPLTHTRMCGRGRKPKPTAIVSDAEGKMLLTVCAKLREAYEFAEEFLRDYGTDWKLHNKLCDMLKSALAAPLRNCDVYTVGEALRKYGFPTKTKPWGEKEWLDFCEWLVSEVEGETKGE